MVKLRIKLNTVNDVGLYVARCGEYENDIDYEYGKYTVDAKSFMGVFSVGFEHECETILYSDDEEIEKKFIDDMALWKVQ